MSDTPEIAAARAAMADIERAFGAPAPMIVGVPASYLSAVLAAHDAAVDERDELREANEAQNYKGNSVHHWWAKAHAYGGIVHGCAPVLAAAGHPIDASSPDGAVGGIARAVKALAAERDALAARLAEVEAALAAGGGR